MIKSAGVRISVKLLLILLAISLFFYFQHPVVYRSANLSAVIPVGDMTFVIEDISVSNLDEDKIHAISEKDKIPWIYRKIWEANLPVEVRTNLFKIASFYSRRPITNENANLKLTGTVIYPAEIRNSEKTDGHEFLDGIEVNVSPGHCSGKGINRMYGDNYCRWQSRGKFNLSDLDKEITLAITDQATNKVSYIYFTPRWEKERLLQTNDSSLMTGPSEPVMGYIHALSQNDIQAALEYVAPEKREAFKSHLLDSEFKNADIRYTVDWNDCLDGYRGSYRVVAEAGKYENNQTDFVAASDNKLVFHTVRLADGKFYIVIAV